MNAQPCNLVQLTQEILARAATRRRLLVALAGPPGVGKSTFSDVLRERLNALHSGWAEVVPMDGFHFDDRVLEARGERPRKGAPHTFDVAGFEHMLRRVKAAAEDVAIPLFDRALEIARAGARIVTAQARIILVEGNYLLLDDPRWAPVRRHFDLSVMLEAPYEELRARLAARWSGLSEAERRVRLDGNDLPNARLVIEHSVAADFRVVSGCWGPEQ